MSEIPQKMTVPLESILKQGSLEKYVSDVLKAELVDYRTYDPGFEIENHERVQLYMPAVTFCILRGKS